MANAEYALQFLDFLGVKLYNNGKRILEYDGKTPDYEIKPLGTKIRVGEDIGGNEEVQYELMSFEEIEQIGFAIRSSDKILWSPRQRRSYSIMRKAIDRIGLSYDSFKKSGIRIQKDATHKRFRMIGDNVVPDPRYRIDSGVGPWIIYEKDAPRPKNHKFSGNLNLGKFGARQEFEEQFVEIGEIPLIITSEKKIVCIKKENIPPRVIVTGASRKGKSVDGDSLILYKEKGIIKHDKIKNIKMSESLEVLSLNGWTRVKAYYAHYDNQPKISIETKSGKKIIGTQDHSFIVMDMYGDILKKEGINLKVGDCFITPNSIENNEKYIDKIIMINKRKRKKEIIIDKDFAFLVGIYLAEGNADINNLVISSKNEDIKKRVIQFCKKNNINYQDKHSRVRIYKSELSQWFKKNCYDGNKVKYGKGSGAERKKIPEIIFNLSNYLIIEFLSGLYSGDGYIQNVHPKKGDMTRTLKSYGIGISFCSERLITDLNVLLSMLGILGTRQTIDRKNKLHITGIHAKKFYEMITLYGRKLDIKRIAGHIGRRYAKKILDEFEVLSINKYSLNKSKELLDIPYFFDYIKKIDIIDKPGVVYDLETEDNTFMANNLFVHNSTFMNAATSRVHENWGDAVGWLIDPQNQFYDISLPQEFSEFKKYISYVGEEPRPLPAIQFYLACKYPQLIVHPKISFNLTLSYFEFLNKYTFFSHGMKDWQIEGTERYLKMLIPHIKTVNNLKEFESACYTHIPGAADEKRQDMKSMIGKLVPTMGSIFKEGFTSNLFDDDITTDQFEVEFPDGRKIKGHPFIIAMEAGLVPIINTSMNPDKPWVRNYLADTMQKIISHQKMMQIEKKRIRMHLVADELQAIYEVGSGRRSDNASRNFLSIFKQGGFNDIGIWVNTQSLERVDKEMIKNATHIGCVYTQSTKERRMIKDLFELPKEVTDMLGQLKTQEIMIFSKEPFVVYDRWGNKEIVTDRTWFKGRIIPPFNYHKCPTLKVKE